MGIKPIRSRGPRHANCACWGGRSMGSKHVNHPCRASAPQLDHCLKMERLREEIRQRDALNRIPRAHQSPQIACQCRRVARNILERSRRDLPEQGSGLRTEAGARRIHNNQIRTLALARRTQEVTRCRLHRSCARAAQIVRQCGYRRRCGLNSNHAVKLLRQPPRKQSDSSPPVTHLANSSTSQRFTWKNAP